MTDTVTASDIYRARQRLQPIIRRTPLQHSQTLSEQLATPVYLKCEHHQITGSFKVRGASNAVANLSAEQKQHGVVGVSTGNHGRGLAHAARQAGVRAVICMSRLVPRNKVDAIRALGADVRIIGNSQDEAQVEVDRLVAEENMTMLPPFDHPDIIAGQGTLGLELMEQLPDLDTVLVPLSGGGLISGIACAIKTIKSSARIYGITMERGCAMHASLRAGKPVTVEELPTLADSLGGGIGFDNRYTLRMVQELVDDTLLVDEAQIADAVRHAYFQERQVIEGGGAVGIAALRAGLVENTGTTVVLMSGCGIDMQLHQRLINGENVDLMQE